MPEVDPRSQGMLVNAAGFLYASIGFSLSVLAAIINLFHHPKAQDVPPLPTQTRANLSLASRGRRIIRSVSDKSAKSPLRTPEFIREPLSPGRHQKSSTAQEPTSQKKVIASRHIHRRSKSMANIPIITIDFFGSTESLHARRSAEIKPKAAPRIPEAIPEPEPLKAPSEPQPPLPSLPTKVSSSEPVSSDSTCTSTAAECGNDQPAPSFRLFGLKPWGKEKSRRLERTKSSPQLCRSSSLPRPSCHKQSSSDGSVDIPTKKTTRTKSLKSLRKVSSVPAQGKEKIGIKCDVTFRHGEKKRSQTLRTQPYDAPYFALPPVPPLPPAYKAPIHQESTTIISPSHPKSNTSKPLDRKSSKPRS